MKVAILITSHNRKGKTIACLESIKNLNYPLKILIDIFLVDDGSIDGTGEAVKAKFPQVKVIQGDGNLFWAGGMNRAWKEALKQKFDGFLLLNDDTILFPSALDEIIETHKEAQERYKQEGIYIGTTQDPTTHKYTYGGHKIINKFNGKSTPVIPEKGKSKECDFANANIMFVSKSVVDTIGVLCERFTHAVADYDYTLRVSKKGIPVLVCPSYLGTCEDDHGNNWLSANTTLKERIKYLKSPKQLAYNEYLFYIKRHFPFYLPIAFIKLWGKTFFPSIWDKYKIKNEI
ncbi:glycosyltransferase family 2 protein [Candidatus Dojkabacteria bacterium]|nr:glycosyltransferase family 2 protein [Candidatus Dojkabacteria bacterium]